MACLKNEVYLPQKIMKKIRETVFKISKTSNLQI